MSQPKTSAWSIVLAFDEVESATPQERDDTSPAGGQRDGYEQTVRALCSAVEPSHVIVLTGDEPLEQTAREAGASVAAPGRDINNAIQRALERVVGAAPERSAAIVVGPLPHASADDIHAALRACAAAESAFIEADDGGTVFLTHHDPAALAPRFGGASAARHARHAVSVGHDLNPVRRRTTAA